MNLERDKLDWSKGIWHAINKVILNRSSLKFDDEEQSNLFSTRTKFVAKKLR